jgi:hypothetical protein
VDEWVGEIVFSPELAAKLRHKHGITPEQVRDAVACGAHEDQWWTYHRIYGRRLALEGSDDNGRMRVYLRPIDREQGTWRCLTAWRTD